MKDWRSYLAAALSIIGSAGWLSSEVARNPEVVRLGAHNEERAQEMATLQADVRELRGELSHCRGTR